MFIPLTGGEPRSLQMIAFFTSRRHRGRTIIPSMSFGEAIIEFFANLRPPENLPGGVEILWPYGNPEVKRVMDAFYRTYLGDGEDRIFLVGINPGRFGAEDQVFRLPQPTPSSSHSHSNQKQ